MAEPTLEEYLATAQRVVERLGFKTKRQERRLYARHEFDEFRSMALVFKTGPNKHYEAFFDFHDQRQLTWLDRLFERKASPWGSWAYVQRLGVLVPSWVSDELEEEDRDYGIETKGTLKTFGKCLADDMSARIIPAAADLNIGCGLDPKHWLRDRTLTFSGNPVGGATRKTWRKGQEMEESLSRQNNCQYWWRGGYLDLSALLALGESRKARWLIERMPSEIGVWQTYCMDLDRVAGERWRRARKNSDAIWLDLAGR